MVMYFDAFRENGEPTFYASVRTPWQADLVVSGLIFCFSIVAASFYTILFGIAGKEKFYSFTRVTSSLFIGAVILTTNFAQTWETAETSTQAKYKTGTGAEINVTVGVFIGFRGVNITLKAAEGQIEGETIDYNEHFSWEGLQGRLGFGPFAGQFNREYRAAQFRGLPLPILWVAEYFTLDGEGIRWGRHYRQAGWYAHIMLWLAFPLWILSNVLFFVLLRYGAYALILTGVSMVVANVIWATYRNAIELEIPFTYLDRLEFAFGASFWLCLITGLLCILLGVVVFLEDKLCPSFIAKFFGVDVLQDSELIQVEGDVDAPTAISTREDYTPGDTNNMAEETLTPEPDGEDQGDELYSAANISQADYADNGIKQSRKIANFHLPTVPKKSFRTPEHRLTKRLQRPRRKEVLPQEYVNTVSPRNVSISMDMVPGASDYTTASSTATATTVIDDDDDDEGLYTKL